MSSQKIIMFQTGIIKLCTVHENEGKEELEKRIEKLEKIIASGNIQSKNNTQESPRVQKNTTTETKKEVKPEEKKAPKKLDGPIETNWKDIVNDFKNNGKIMLYTNLMNTTATEINDMTVGIEFPNGITPFGKAVLEKSENIREIEKQVSIICGKEMRVKFIDTKKDNTQQSQSASNSIEAFAKNLDVPFNIMDE